MSPVREPELNTREVLPDICVCCGKPVPEGYMVCPDCERENYGEESFGDKFKRGKYSYGNEG